jgi:NADPH-dependent 2,4-dienoyl-CoA reductase/sulfur reductase-like enzyme
VRKLVVIGGGVAGVECALTLARGLPDDRVTLVAHAEVVRVLPDLVYVPGGVSPQRIELPVRELVAGADVEVAIGEVESVDLSSHVVHTDVGDVPFDVVVAAPGAQPLPTSGFQLQTLDQALALRDRLDELFGYLEASDERATILIRAAADDAWSPPAYELAALLAARIRARGLTNRVTVTLLTAELSPFQWFEPRVADLVVGQLHDLQVELATGVPEARFDDLDGTVVVDFGRMEARHVCGLPGRDERGWYATDGDGRVHPDAFVIGDAASHGFKAAFAAAWQARRVLVALGGSLRCLGADVGGVPADYVEHHVDLGNRTLRIRLPVAAPLHDPWLGRDSTVQLDDAPPDRLAGLLVGSAIRATGIGSAAAAHRALVTRAASRPHPATRARLASSPSP